MVLVVANNRTPIRRRGLFFPAKDKSLAKKISITSPTAFRKSVRVLKKGGLTRGEQAALVLARNRAGAQLGRRNLSPKERKQFTAITKVRIPKLRK